MSLKYYSNLHRQWNFYMQDNDEKKKTWLGSTHSKLGENYIGAPKKAKNIVLSNCLLSNIAIAILPFLIDRSKFSLL